VNKSYTSSGTSNETGTEQALVSYINNTNIPNISNDLKIANLDEQAKKIQIDDELLKKVDEEKEKSSAKKEMFSTFADDNRQIIQTFADTAEKQTEKRRQKENMPTIENVKTYFLGQNFPEIEAIKFFNYFSSNGWLVGGKTPMVDWQAAAQNWILNAPKFISNEPQSNRAKHLNTGTDKDYSEPL
jgi:hypothetical protein